MCVLVLIAISAVSGHQHADDDDDTGSPLLDLASSFLQSQLANQNGGGSGGGGGGGLNLEALGSIASLVGNLVQPDAKTGGGRGGGGGGGIGAAQILSGLGSLMAGANGGGSGGGGGFDPAIIGNVIEMFTSQQGGGNSGGGANKRRKRNIEPQQQDSGMGLDTVLNLVSMFTNNMNGNNAAGNGKRSNGAGGATENAGEGLLGLLPMVMQAVNSFAGADGDRTRAKHKDHAFVLPPFLEKVHVMWDHFAHSELAEALWQKSGVHAVFKVFFQQI